MARQPVRARRLSDEEGQTLLRIVRRGNTAMRDSAMLKPFYAYGLRRQVRPGSWRSWPST